MIYIDIQKPTTVSFPIWADVESSVTITIIDANEGEDIIDCTEDATDILNCEHAEISTETNALTLRMYSGNKLYVDATVVPLDANIRDVDFKLSFNRVGTYDSELWQNGELIGTTVIRIMDGDARCTKYIVKK